MKRIITILMVAAIMLTMTACGAGGKQPNTSDVMKKITSETKLPEMAEVTKENLSIYLDLDTKKIDQLSYSVASSGVDGEEVFISKMASGTDMNAIKTKLEARRDAQSELFSSYNPEAAAMIKKAAIEIKGDYAFYAVTSDSTKAKKVFLDSFK
ncbi:DUF4358 domain-containing protein [Paludicola sp. MB14-C6]|uniref:DUF4358 domain-containing protein n=1 Tax=Paludihabitans sp. MB14-C6 TaxID=3070656 RepID=UPI0027DADC21|nr:DUF4358 domain-containing protein [Paludicola sp. MB14-C6]WMJ22593.1 DUF4358 domain-containing protein [Paludicola sp. MB14-C6]